MRTFEVLGEAVQEECAGIPKATLVAKQNDHATSGMETYGGRGEDKGGDEACLVA